MMLKSVLTTITILAQSQFWADSSSLSKELEKAKEYTTQVQVVCGAVEISLPGQLPDYSIECDPYYPGDNQGD